MDNRLRDLRQRFQAPANQDPQALLADERLRFQQRHITLFQRVRAMLEEGRYVRERRSRILANENEQSEVYLRQAREALQLIRRNDHFNERRRRFLFEAAEAAAAAREYRKTVLLAILEAVKAAEARDLNSFKIKFNNERSKECGWRIAKVLRLDNEGNEIYIDGIVANKKLTKGTRINMPLYKINVQDQNPYDPVDLGDKFFYYDTLEDFQLTYGFAYKKKGFELLPTIPMGCDIAMFSNEPPLEPRINGNVVSPNKPNAEIVAADIPTGDTEGEVTYYIKLTQNVKKNEEIVWDYGPGYRRTYTDYWGNNPKFKFKRGEKVNAYYAVGDEKGWYTATIRRYIKRNDAYLVIWDDGRESEVSWDYIEKI